MKIQLISPNFPPQNCGVGDYSYFLADAFKKAGHETAVQRRFESDDPHTITFIQYTPQLFRSLIACLLILFRSRGKIVFYFHELFFPPSLSLLGLLIGVPHWIRFVVLLHLAPQSIFSTARFYDQWKNRFPYLKNKMSWVPVGSNIPVLMESSPDQLPKKDSDVFQLFHFGGAHPTHLFDYIFSSFQALLEQKAGIRYQLVLVGVTPQMLEPTLARYPELIDHPDVLFLGYLSADRVSQAIKNADLVLAPFMDGATTRRGSLIAALAHGKLVITTLGSVADTQATPWNDFLIGVGLNQENSKARFIKVVEQWALAPVEKRKEFELKAQKAYQEFFSWEVIVKKLLASSHD